MNQDNHGQYGLIFKALENAAKGRKANIRFGPNGEIQDLSRKPVESSADMGWTWKEKSFISGGNTLKTVMDSVLASLERHEAVESGEWVRWDGLTTSFTNHPNVIETPKVIRGLSNIALYLEKRYNSLRANAETPFTVADFRRFLSLSGRTSHPEDWDELLLEIEQSAYAIFGSDSPELWGGYTMLPLIFSQEIIFGRILPALESILHLISKINFWADGDGHSVGKSPPARLKKLAQLLQATAIRLTQSQVEGAISLGADRGGKLSGLFLRLEATKRGARVGNIRRKSFSNGNELAQELRNAPELPLNEELATRHEKIGLTAAYIEPRFNEAVVKQLYEVLHQVPGLEGVDLSSDEFEVPKALPHDIPGGLEADWLLQHLWLLAKEIGPRAQGTGSFLISDSEQPEMAGVLRNMKRLLDLKDMDIVSLLETDMLSTGKSELLDKLILSAEESVMVALSDLKKRYGLFGFYLELFYLRKIVEAGKIPYLGGDMFGELFRSLGMFHNKALSELKDPLQALDMLRLIGIDPVNTVVKIRQTLQGDTSAKKGLTGNMLYDHLVPIIPSNWEFEKLEIPQWFFQICDAARLNYLELIHSPDFGNLYMHLSKFPPIIVISGRPDQKSGGLDGDNDPKPKTVESCRAIIFNQTSLVGGLGALRLAGTRTLPDDVLIAFKDAYEEDCVFARHMTNYWHRSLMCSAPERLETFPSFIDSTSSAIERLQSIDSKAREMYQEVTGLVSPGLPQSVVTIEDDLRALLKQGAKSPAKASLDDRATVKTVFTAYETGG